MSNIINDGEHWLSRAEEAQTLAEQIADPVVRASMMAGAESYRRIAKNAGNHFTAHVRLAEVFAAGK